MRPEALTPAMQGIYGQDPTERRSVVLRLHGIGNQASVEMISAGLCEEAHPSRRVSRRWP